jgi:hypothetical protein
MAKLMDRPITADPMLVSAAFLLAQKLLASSQLTAVAFRRYKSYPLYEYTAAAYMWHIRALSTSLYMHVTIKGAQLASACLHTAVGPLGTTHLTAAGAGWVLEEVEGVMGWAVADWVAAGWVAAGWVAVEVVMG